MEQHYQRIIKDTQKMVSYALKRQERNPESPYYGGFYDRDCIVQAKFAIYQVTDMIAVYCNEDTEYYRNKKVYDSIMLGLDYIRSVQHENGLFDYITCNFYSAPDTAFCIEAFVPIVDYWRAKSTKSDEEKLMAEKVEAIVKDGTYGLLEGGFHTPNHRWAIASLLTKGSVLYNDEKLKEAAFQYLNEGIDCNEDGEFAEKSAGNYNGVNDDAMILLSESLGDNSYDENAVKNLKLMLYYWEPDSSVFTANSTRFDKDRLVYPQNYYLNYLKMGLKYNIPEFLQMCNTIFDIIQEKNVFAPDILIWFMLKPEYRSLIIEGSYKQPDFKKHCAWSGIYRARKGDFTYTIMREKSNFLYFHSKSIKLEMKVAGSFCEHRAFKAETMEVTDEGIVHLHQTMRGWYYLPFKEKPETSDWWQMDQTKRPKKYGPNMDIDVYVTEVEDGIDVRVKTSGVKGAPWRIEMAFSGIEFLAADHIMLPVNGSEVLVIKDKELEAYNTLDSVTVGPGFGEHRFTEGKEDSEVKNAGCATVYYTDYTEFDHTIHIRNTVNK